MFVDAMGFRAQNLDDIAAPSIALPFVQHQNEERTTLFFEGASDDEDMPLARLQTLLKDRREEESQQVDADIVLKILDEPMWTHMPFSPVGAAFSGASESPPDNLYFTELITDEMIEKIEVVTHNYALSLHYI